MRRRICECVCEFGRKSAKVKSGWPGLKRGKVHHEGRYVIKRAISVLLGPTGPCVQPGRGSLNFNEELNRPAQRYNISISGAILPVN